MSDIAMHLPPPASRIPGHPYAGDVSPGDALAMLRSDPAALLIDVRTPEEWQADGIPDTAAMFEPWRNAAGYNPHFLDRLATAQPDRAAPLFFLCRVGGRSFEAANAAAGIGYTRAYNIAHGLEGDPAANGERGVVNGWKAEGLPWRRR